MSANTMLPASAPLKMGARGALRALQPGPGLSSSAIDSLAAAFPGNLTADHKALLVESCGIEGTALGYLDFTGQLHAEETLAVFRPCMTLAADGRGRRWIAETANARGLPGPVWCVLQDPKVVMHVSEDLGAFLELLHRRRDPDSLEAWLESIDRAALEVSRQRGVLAFQSRHELGHDRKARDWLLQIPRDARVYDLRSPTPGGWPYDTGGGGRLHRCGKERLFAVSGFPAPTRWADYLGNLARHHETPVPAILATDRGQRAST